MIEPGFVLISLVHFEIRALAVSYNTLRKLWFCVRMTAVEIVAADASKFAYLLARIGSIP
jgi:hypothetical protein